MWVQELGLLYEDWRTLGNDQTPSTKYAPNPVVAKPNLSIRNYKIGTQQPSILAASEAGNVPFGNPTEQEEEIINKNISNLKVINLINSEISKLDHASPTDRVALMVLENLKNKIKSL